MQTETENPFTHIRIQVSRANDGSWGAETTDEEAEIVARNGCALAVAYARHYWPGADIEADVTDWPDTRLNNYTRRADGDQVGAEDGLYGDENPSRDIDNFLAGHWYHEPLWAADFDADAYLAEVLARRAASAA